MASRLTAQRIQSTTPGTWNDTVIPGMRYIRTEAGKRTCRISPRCSGPEGSRQLNIRVYTFTASNPQEAGEQLAEAREAARTILRDAARGVDPVEAKRAKLLADQRARRDTFTAVAAQYMEEHGQNLSTATELQRKLDKEILPVLGHIPVADVRRADVKALFLAKAAVAPVAANRILALIRAILFYAVDEELVEANVASRIKARPETARDRTLNDDDIRRLWHGLDNVVIAPDIARVLKLLLLTGQRRAEVVEMQWSELDFEKAIWEIPASRAKTGHAHRVHLTKLAIELIGLPGGTERVFDMAPIAVSDAMRHALPALGLSAPATPHDLRRTCATSLGDLGVELQTISRILNHALSGTTTRVYDKGAYAEPKKIALEAWANRLAEIVTGEAAPSNVTAIRGAAG